MNDDNALIYSTTTSNITPGTRFELVRFSGRPWLVLNLGDDGMSRVNLDVLHGTTLEHIDQLAASLAEARASLVRIQEAKETR